MTLSSVGVVEDARVVDADASGERLIDAQFDRCAFERVQLTGSDLRGSRWCDVVVAHGELSGALVSESELVRVEFEGGRAAGVVFVESTLRHVRFHDVRLDGATFREATLEQCVFEGCNLTDAEFADAKLDAVEFVDCNLHRADFSVERCARLSFVRSNAEALRGVTKLRGASVTTDMVLPLAMSLFTAVGLEVVDADDLRDRPRD